MKANNKTNISLQNKRIFFKKSIEFFIIFFHEVIHEKRPAGKDYQISDIYFFAFLTTFSQLKSRDVSQIRAKPPLLFD
jgi:hypothetical protein